MIKKCKKQFKSFIHERFLYQKVSLCSGIHKNNFDPLAPKANAIGKIQPTPFN